MNYIISENPSKINISAIPVLDYDLFAYTVLSLLSQPNYRCVNYFGYYEFENQIHAICIIGDDQNGCLMTTSFKAKPGSFRSLTTEVAALHCFEREMSESLGITFEGHPWMKPIRFPHDSKMEVNKIQDYPFFSINSTELHEVGVGPIHAGIIEPGHFRFSCNGEKVLHLEIHLGYQHRAIEKLITESKNENQRAILIESIAGDSVAANSVAYANIIESLSDIAIHHNIKIERAIALELERIAIHTGDLSALCTDIAYQLGSTVLQGLRTVIINSFQTWCGSRFARKLIRPASKPYPLNSEIINTITQTLIDYEKKFVEVTDCMFNLPTVLSRFEKTGEVTSKQALKMGFVGMAARSSGIERDIRATHPHGLYCTIKHKMITHKQGDVWARAMLRKEEILQSLSYINKWLDLYDLTAIEETSKPIIQLDPESLAISLTEGWRGEICHTAITDRNGKICHYKIKDPSLHNWFALALAVRDNDISDFPVCNKSFDLSYCGYDL